MVSDHQPRTTTQEQRQTEEEEEGASACVAPAAEGSRDGRLDDGHGQRGDEEAHEKDALELRGNVQRLLHDSEWREWREKGW